jgi:hypothetical protein
MNGKMKGQLISASRFNTCYYPVKLMCFIRVGFKGIKRLQFNSEEIIWMNFHNNFM